MQKIRKGSIVRLICGQISAAVFMIGIPAVLIFGLFDHMPWPHVWLTILAMLHVGLVAAQIAISGDAVPRGWLAGVYLSLPLFNVLAGWSAYRNGAYWILACCVAFLVLSLQVAASILLGHSTNDSDSTRPPASQTADARPFHAEDDVAMMDF